MAAPCPMYMLKTWRDVLEFQDSSCPCTAVAAWFDREQVFWGPGGYSSVWREVGPWMRTNN